MEMEQSEEHGNRENGQGPAAAHRPKVGGGSVEQVASKGELLEETGPHDGDRQMPHVRTGLSSHET